jgi:hypothetical protein
MNLDDFRELVRRMASTLSFAWLQMKPELLQTYHQLAIDSSPKLSDIRAPLDAPVHDLAMGTQIRPSEMQAHLLQTIVPVTLVAIQSIAEDVLGNATAPPMNTLRRIAHLVSTGRIDRALASEAHHWRMVRNVIAHAQGVIDSQTETEAAKLLAEGKVSFSRFKLWGALLDAGHGGSPVPIIDQAVRTLDSGVLSIEIQAGERVDIGVGDLLAAGKTWASLIEAAALTSSSGRTS